MLSLLFMIQLLLLLLFDISQPLIFKLMEPTVCRLFMIIFQNLLFLQSRKSLDNNLSKTSSKNSDKNFIPNAYQRAILFLRKISIIFSQGFWQPKQDGQNSSNLLGTETDKVNHPTDFLGKAKSEGRCLVL